jgi:protein TonB
LPEQAVSDEPILLIQPQRTDKEQPRPAFDPKRTPTDRAIADEKPTPRAAVPAPPLASDIGRGRSELDANYRGLVAAHLARHKRFPEEARRRRQTGHAVVTFSLDGRGNVTSVAVVRRSGVNSLDKEAEAMVRRAAPFPAPPNGAPVSFTVPVRFDLR